MRRIINICKNAEDNWLKKSNNNKFSKLSNILDEAGLISSKDVKEAISQLFYKNVNSLISTLKLYEKLVIIAISIETNSSNSKSGKIDISSVYTRFFFSAKKRNEYVYNYVSICKTVYRDEQNYCL